VLGWIYCAGVLIMPAMIQLRHFISYVGVIALMASSLALSGCGPDLNAAANRLRQQTIDQDRQIGDLKQKVASRDEIIQGLRSDAEKKSPPVQTLPHERLAELFTVGRVDLQPTTYVSDLDGAKGAAGFRVFFRTMTDDGVVFPATGTLTIEAFDLPAAPASPTRLGTWTFTPEQMKQSWYSGLGLNHFAFNCPWSAAPSGENVQLRATFVDALTGNTLTAELSKKLTPPPATAPAK
jgi:hypothetical protein